MKKIIFINRFFWPDHSATAQILTDLTQHIIPENAEVHIITSRLLYSDSSVELDKYENLARASIHRVWTSRFGRSVLVGRAVDYLTFYISSFLCLLRITKKGDVVIAKTDPPLISLVAGIVTKAKRATLINWLQDIFPEVGRSLGISVFENNLIFRLIRKLRNITLDIAEKNIVLGEKMAAYVRGQIQNPESIEIIPNWVVGRKVENIPKQENPLINEWHLNGRFVIAYSGNLGRAHDYQTIFNTARLLEENKEVVFVVVGGGAGYDELKKLCDQSGLSNIMFKPYQPIEKLSYSLSVGDVHVVTLEPSMEGLIVPSKYYGILAVSKPILFLGDNDGEIGGEVEREKIGKALKLGDADGMVKAIENLKENPAYTKELCSNAYRLYQDKYLPDNSYRKWLELLRGIG